MCENSLGAWIAAYAELSCLVSAAHSSPDNPGRDTGCDDVGCNINMGPSHVIWDRRPDHSSISSTAPGGVMTLGQLGKSDAKPPRDARRRTMGEDTAEGGAATTSLRLQPQGRGHPHT